MEPWDAPPHPADPPRPRRDDESYLDLTLLAFSPITFVCDFCCGSVHALPFLFLIVAVRRLLRCVTAEVGRGWGAVDREF